MAEVGRVANRVGLVRDGVLAQELSLDELRRHAGDRLRFASGASTAAGNATA